ncbi:EAL domain-containing protein [Pseudoduganella sp. UC29_106]|uniref:bifunctional diguanylate cyclase/phosphodiesterase n=1 Tax=Pseudoduganella sp. UC29_106 TaxID=3374553 RepID=UPI00375789DE
MSKLISDRYWPLAWPVLALLAVAAFWLLAFSRASNVATQAEQAARREVSAHADAYEQYLTRTIAQMDQVTMQLKHSWEKSDGKLQLEALYRDGMFTDPAFIEASVFDREGKLLSSAGHSRRGENLPSSFSYHQKNISSALRIDVPAGNVRANQPLVQFTRRLDDAQDGFAGVLALYVDARYLTSFYNRRVLGNGGFIAVSGDNSGLRLEQHGGSVHIQAGESLFSMAPDFGGASGISLVQGSAFHDGAERILSWRHSSAYPVLAMAGMTADEALAPARADWSARREGAWWFTALALAVGALGWRHAARSVRSRRRDEEVQLAYRTATEQANDGFYLASAIRNSRDEVVDFEVADCNERGAFFYGLNRGELVGRRVSELDAAVFGSSLLPIYQAAMASGFYEDERQMAPGAHMNISWGYRRIIRVGDSLAITLQDMSARKLYESDLERMANQDMLTGLANRHWLQRFMPRAIAAAADRQAQLGLLFIGLDDFKQVNDTLGHAAGDLVLQTAARRLEALLRAGSQLARVGGDEFVVLLDPLANEDEAAGMAERVLAAFARPFSVDGGTVSVGASVGISLYPRDGRDHETLLRHGDIAMYSSKNENKGKYRFFDPVQYVVLTARAQLQHSLRAAIDSDQLQLHYQARVELSTGRLASMEALLRWQHPELGMVPLAKFIPLAESSGLIVRIGELVMERACAQLAAWREQGLPLVPVSVNVSPRQFSYGSIHSQLALQLARYAIPAHLIEVEITESAMVADQPEVQAELAAIRSLGVRVYVDDFGTGYSSLSQLQKLRLDGLKVDKAFTSELERSSEGKVFFQAIISMARALGMVVVAEGVETAQQLSLLKELGCNEAQGYHVGRPEPAADMALRLATTELPVLADIG